jgi:hypothetical protein
LIHLNDIYSGIGTAIYFYWLHTSVTISIV